MDFRHTTYDSPIGVAVAVLSSEGLVSLRFASSPDQVGSRVRDIAEQLRSPLAQDDASADVSRLRRELDEYFEGERREFETPLDLRLVRGFVRDALTAIVRIPYGETASYGEVAVLAGAPRAARAVGTACATTPVSVVIPVHRVVRADGSLGEYGGRPEVKRFLLDLERA